MKTKNLLNAVSLTLTLIVFFPVVTFAQGTWTQKADYPGGKRYSLTSFSIGTKGYVGLGFDIADNDQLDFWEFDQATNVWTRKADSPGKSGRPTVSFSIGTKGYIVYGLVNYIHPNTSVNDFWEYDPATNNWTQKASLPDTPAGSEAAGFSIGNKGYIIIYGSWNVAEPFQYFFEWDQSSDLWIKKTDFDGIIKSGAIGFSIGSKGYILSEWSDGTNYYYKDFWEWDQTTNVWSKKADYPGNGHGVSFSIGNKGYIGTGYDNTINGYTNEFWEWDQITNVWTKKTDFSGIPRDGAVGFTIGDKGYIGTGGDGGFYSTYNDFWEFTPSAITGLKAVTKEKNFFYPNPASDFITLKTSHTENSDLTLNIYKISGELITSETLLQNLQNINISWLSNGIYIVEVKSKGGLEKQKLIVQR